jgi:uncharacterized protein with PhoU and TrkA domain
MGILERRLVQVVLSRKSALIGKTVRESRFRTQFDAAIVAVHRAGERLRMRIGDVLLAVRCPSPFSTLLFLVLFFLHLFLPQPASLRGSH